MLAQALLCVPRDTQTANLSPRLPDQCGEGVRVAAGDLTSREDVVAPVQVHDLLSRSEEGDAGPAVDGNGLVRDRGEDAELRGPQRCAGGENEGARAQVLAARPDVAPGVPGVVDSDLVGAGRRGVFLADDGIGTVRDGRTGKDACGLTGCERSGGELAGGYALDDPQHGARSRVVE